MTQPTSGDREKVVSKLPTELQRNLKVRSAQHGIDIQHAVEAGITAWRGLGSNLPTIDTSGAKSFSTFLPEGQWDEFRVDCSARGVSIVQGLSQSVALWLEKNPAPAVVRPRFPRRIITCNQKGGVGKTAVAAGLGQAMAEDSDRLHLVRISKHLVALLIQGVSEPGEELNPLDYEEVLGLG
ncbi:nucleotide-binding protein, partial [Streptomyces roseoviridis]